MVTFERTPREGGDVQTRCNSRFLGLGRRSKSCNQINRNSPSQKNIPAINRGNQTAGTTQPSPSRSARKNLAPNPHLSRPVECARADTVAGTKVPLELTSGPRRRREFLQ